jgi:hypothetical protein
VTVLFADLKGSMELLADRDPVLERMMEAVWFGDAALREESAGQAH